MRLCCDIEGTITDTVGAMCFLLGIDPKLVDSWDYISNRFGKKVFWDTYRLVWKEQLINPIETSKQVFSFMQAMRKMNIQVDYVSGIPEDCEQYLRDWLIKNELAFADIVRVGNVQDKVALGYQLFVDDPPLLQIRDGQTLFLYNQSWNENVIYNVYENVHRVFSLAEVVKLLNKEERCKGK